MEKRRNGHERLAGIGHELPRTPDLLVAMHRKPDSLFEHVRKLPPWIRALLLSGIAVFAVLALAGLATQQLLPMALGALGLAIVLLIADRCGVDSRWRI